MSYQKVKYFNLCNMENKTKQKLLLTSSSDQKVLTFVDQKKSQPIYSENIYLMIM